MLNKYPIVLQTGFRIFFLGAVIHSIISVTFWMCFYIFSWNIFVAMPVNIWHGHEMIYGFTMAVVAGFLLTAVTNWTGHQTLTGWPLLILFLFWATGRILAFLPVANSLILMAACDNAFLFFLIFSILNPIIKAKQWRQSAVISKVILIFICSIFFYLTLASSFIRGTHLGLLFAVYMVISLILTISRRVIPFFVEKGVGYPVSLKNSRALDITSLVLLVLFCIIDVFLSRTIVVPILAAGLALVHIIRLAGWFTPGIFKKPLLWVLFVGYSFIIIGFILKALSFKFIFLADCALHAFTYGGIGVMILGMISRVSLGHTGRSIADPPKILPSMFLILIIGACIRIFFPIIEMNHYPIWIAVSQLMWMLAFIIFLIVYFPILISARVDGKEG